MKQTRECKHTLSEIINQPLAWAATIDIVEAKSDELLELMDGVDEIVFTGCGSALNVSVTAAATFQQLTGIRARAVPAADLEFFPDTVFASDGAYLVVPISRSGSTTETVMASDVATGRGIKTLAITCYPDSPLACRSTRTLTLEPANEQSVTTTQSLTSMILTTQLISGIIAERSDYLAELRLLPELGQQVIDRYGEMGREVAETASITKFAFVGSGPYLGLARESQLKIKEMTLLPSDSYPVLDYRHGPKSNVDEEMLVTLFMSDRGRRIEVEFLEEMKYLNGNVLVICDKAELDTANCADYSAEVNSGLCDMARGILYMPPIHFLAYYKSLALGQDPDNPRNLTYWVETLRL